MTFQALRGRSQLLATTLGLCLLSACGDDDHVHDELDADCPVVEEDEDAAVEESEDDAGKADAGVDTGTDAGGDASADKITIARASAVGHDRFYGVAHDKDGKIVAVGQVSSSIETTADYAILVARFLPTGEVDKTFGNDGFAVKNVAVGGQVASENGENGRGVVILSDGKIVVAGQAEHDPAAAGLAARDMDVVLVKFNTNGTVDETWGTKGVVRHDLNTGTITSTTNATTMVTTQSWTGSDVVWSLGLSGDKYVVHGNQRATGNKTDGTPRTDTDWALLRLNADGSLDTSFNGTGKVTLDIGEVGNSARSASVLADGSIIGAGYTTTTGLISAAGQSTQQPVLYKVTPSGAFDTTFATADKTTAPGVFYDLVVPETLRCEAYGAAVQGDKLVTIGYGPTTAPTTGAATSDVIYARFSAEGAPDKSFGKDGTVYHDPGMYGDNGRALVVLPDNRLLGLGGARPTPAVPPTMGNPPVDAYVGLLEKDGEPSDYFGKDSGGFKLYDLGGTNDFFWAGSVAPDKKSVAVVGIASGASTANDDDAALLILPLD
jgi:uncharacterized delta-60 repeat protein